MGSFFDAEGRAGAERGVANTNVLELGKGFVRSGGAWDSDVRTPTRLADDPHVTLRLARIDRPESGSSLTPGRMLVIHYTSVGEAWRAWRLSEVSVSAGRVSGEAEPATEYAKAARAAKMDWARYDAEKVLVLLKSFDADETLYGAAVSVGEKEVRLSYNSRVGLKWEGAVPN